MGGFLDILLSVVLSCICTFLNAASDSWRLFFKKKANISPSKYVVVITGCDTGFGEMAATQLSKLNFHVVAACLTPAGMESLSGRVALTVKCDVTKEADVKELADKTTAYCADNGCKLWALVNNAGIGTGGCLDWLPLGLYRQVLEVNFFGVVSVTKEFLPLLKSCPNARVVNLSSVAGLLGGAKMTAYCASKHAVEGFGKGLRAELKPWGVTVCNINPGFMK